MFLTGKAKESFEKNLEQNYRENKRDYLNTKANRTVLENFYRMPLCFQIGPYIDWLDSTGIRISISFSEENRYSCTVCSPERVEYSGFRTRAEARIKGLQEAGQFFNQRSIKAF